MNVIQDIIREEYQRLSSLEKRYKSRVSRLPKGTLSIKERGSKSYAYLTFRDSRGKVASQYIGVARSCNDSKSSRNKNKHRYCRAYVIYVKNIDFFEDHLRCGGEKNIDER
jgi:hypothetical protein